MSEFLSHVGDYSGVGFLRGVSLSRKLITSRFDEGANTGTFVDANIPVGSYLHSAKGVILQRHIAQLKTTGRDIPFHAFGYSNAEVQDAFEYPNEFTIITPDNPRWGEYDAFFQDIIIIGEERITQPGYYSYTLNTAIPETVGVRWYTEGGGFEEDRTDAHHMGFVVTEDHWNMVTDEHELHIFCEINVPHLGKQTVLKKIVLEAHEPLPTETTPDLEVAVLYPYEQFLPEINNLAVLSVYESTNLKLHDATFLRWSITSGEKRKILYSTVAEDSTVNLVLSEMYDIEAPNEGPLTVSISVDIVCGEDVIATAATYRTLIKPEAEEPPPPELAPIARIDSSVDLHNINIADGYIDLNANESTISPGTSYWYRWRISSTEVAEAYQLESMDSSAIIPLRHVVNPDGHGSIPIEIELRVKSASTPKFVSVARMTGLVLRPAAPEQNPVPRITTVPADISAIRPSGAGKIDSITISAPTSEEDARYTYEYNYEIRGELGVITHSTEDKAETFIIATKDLVDVGGYDNVEVPITLTVVSKNNSRMKNAQTLVATYVRPFEPNPVSRINTSPADLSGKTISVTNAPLSFESDASTLADNIDYDSLWTIQTSEKTFTSKEPVLINLPLSAFVDVNGIGEIGATASLTSTSLRSLNKTNTSTISFKINRPAEVVPVAVITSPQDLLNIGIPKDEFLEFSAATSATDNRVDYTYTWTARATRGRVTESFEGKNVSIPLSSFVDVKGFGNTMGTVTLQITSHLPPIKTSRATQNVTIHRRDEQAPTPVISTVQNLMLLKSNETSFNLSAEKSLADPFLELENYVCKWEILVGGAAVHTITGMNVDVPLSVLGALTPAGEKDFNVRLTLTSPNRVITATESVAGKVTVIGERMYTPLFSPEHTIRSIQIPRWEVTAGTLSFNLRKKAIVSTGTIQDILSLKVNDKPLVLSVVCPNVNEFHLIISDETLSPFVKVNGIGHDHDNPTMLHIDENVSIEITGKLRVDNLFGSTSEQYGFTGQLTNFVMTDEEIDKKVRADNRHYPLTKATSSLKSLGAVIEDVVAGEGNTHGIIHEVGNNTASCWTLL